MRPAVAKKQKEKRAREKDRATERIKGEEREIGHIAKSFEQHFVNVPGDGMKREKPVLIPRLLQNIRDMRIAKVEDGMEARVVVDGSEQTDRDGNNQKINEHARLLPGLLQQRFKIFGVGRDPSNQKIEKNREAEGQLGAIANCEGEQCSGQKRSEFNQNKIERGYLTEHGKAEGQLPGTAKTESAPTTRSKSQAKPTVLTLVPIFVM